MRILILGDPNKYFRLEYVKNMKRFYPECFFDIASTKEFENVNNSYNNIIKLPYDNKNTKLGRLIELRKSIKALEEYDCIHIHSANLVWLPVIDVLRKKCKKIILTYYGSDFYRSSKLTRFLFKRYNSVVDIITFTSARMKDDLSNMIKDKSKIRVIPFGNNVLKEIDKIRHIDKKLFKEHLNINPQNLVITIGYNSTKQQNHLKVMEIINKIYSDCSNITVCLPLNYGDSEYKNELISRLSDYPFPVVYSDNFLHHDEVALLRAASDIMIHVQNSDQFSASVIEYLYADNVLINGSWIKYKELEDWGVYFKYISNYVELEEQLKMVISNIENEKNKLNARNILNKYLSWEKVCKEWRSLYEI